MPSKFKVRQQKFALRLALFVLRKNGFEAPTKKHVLNFIRAKRLLQFPDEELEKRHDADIDEIWANDIAWKRKDLYMDGEVDSPEKGKWRLTEIGVRKIDQKKEKWADLKDPARRESFLADLEYCTPELVDWMIKIASDDSLLLVSRTPPR
jgi:restriction endonuclease Mrr